ncbi:hypothetical protein N431DRAFT_464173 [Stipitochalara longipes BDJ]|nr:hypothetical protein N431DRAFT_464173 [Stipitochalara longipes BDJ]
MDVRPQAIKKGGLQQLQQLLFCSSLDPLYIAIDFERAGFIANNFSSCSDTQAGISILDSRYLNPPLRKSALKLETYNFITGSDSYYAESAKKFFWGTSEKTHPSKMLKCINKLLRRDRNIVLVGDLAALCSLGFDFQTSVMGILDTANISSELEMDRCTLGRLLGELECPKSSARLHNAGNDANFNLRALILLAIKGYEQQRLGTLMVGDERVSRMEALRSIAMIPLPGVRQPKDKWPRKKHVAKTWLLEKQGEIREERRQKRITNTAIASLTFYSTSLSQKANHN